MNLLWLLLGPGKPRQDGAIFLGFGLLLLGLGAVLALDPAEVITEFALGAVGYTLVAFGLFKVAFAILGTGEGMPSTFAFRGGLLVILGIAVADFPDASSEAVPWLFGLVILANGLYQLASALIIRFPRWGAFVASGIAHLVFAVVLFRFWHQVSAILVPLLLGGALIVLGATALRLGWRLRRLSPPVTESHAGAAEEVRYYLDFHLPARFRRADSPPPVSEPDAQAPHGELMVHVWTPTAVARLENPDPSLVNRYLIAQDKAGKIAVGHAAMEMTPDLYISHCDGDPEGYDGTEEAWKELRSKDVSGVFLPSFQEEIEHYLLPSVTLRYRNFDAGRLRTFWAMYRQVTTYNLTNRNCSVAVALALEAALMGSMAGRSRVRAFLSLLFNRDLWVAHFLRWKAREMVWTPGMILDYALALHRIVEA